MINNSHLKSFLLGFLESIYNTRFYFYQNFEDNCCNIIDCLNDIPYLNLNFDPVTNSVLNSWFYIKTVESNDFLIKGVFQIEKKYPTNMVFNIGLTLKITSEEDVERIYTVNYTLSEYDLYQIKNNYYFDYRSYDSFKLKVYLLCNDNAEQHNVLGPSEINYFNGDNHKSKLLNEPNYELLPYKLLPDVKLHDSRKIILGFSLNDKLITNDVLSWMKSNNVSLDENYEFHEDDRVYFQIKFMD